MNDQKIERIRLDEIRTHIHTHRQIAASVESGRRYSSDPTKPTPIFHPEAFPDNILHKIPPKNESYGTAALM